MNIIIKQITPSLGGEEVTLDISVISDNGEHCDDHKFVISAKQYWTFRFSGSIIGEDEFELIESAAEIHRAVKAALRLMEYGDNSAGKLIRKLNERGFSREAARAASEHLRQMQLLDEGEMLRRAFGRCVKKGWGLRKIMNYLCAEGFSAESRELAAEIAGGIDFAEICIGELNRAVGQGKFSPGEDGRFDRREGDRAGQYLSRRGFSYEEIKKAIQQVGRDTDVR